MANQTPDEERRALRPLGTRECIDADQYRGFLMLTSDGPALTIPLQALHDITSAANTLHDDDVAEVIRWHWTEPADPVTGRGPLVRAARLVVEEFPLTVPVSTDAELAREPGSTETRYEITFTDGSVISVVPDDDNDVSMVGDGVTIYGPNRRTTFPWHRVRAVTLYGR